MESLMLRSRVALRFVSVVGLLMLGACSALVDPDVDGLGSANDGGGPIVDIDGGMRDGGGPVVDIDLGARDAGGADLGMRDAGAPDSGTAMPCSGDPRCAEGALITCMGGREVRTPCALGCAPGGLPRCAEFGPSNLPPDLLDAATGDVVIEDGEVGYVNTNDCNALDGDARVVPQMAGPELCVLPLGTLTVRAGGSLFAEGQRPLVLLASGDVEIAGTLDVSAEGATPGPGGGLGGAGSRVDGTGTSPGIGGVHIDTFDDGGGGGGGLCGAGGAGGAGGTAAGGAGGAGVMTELSPLVGGSGGGRGRGLTTSMTVLSGPGGAGGGALQITTLGTLRVSGEILAGGGGGGGGRTGGSGNWGSGGGGGSGGAVLLEAARLDVSAGARIVVAAGGGGGGAFLSGDSADDGNDGIGDPPAAGGAGGGGAGALAELAGAAGTANTASGANGGGGGGGSGCVVVRAGSGAASGVTTAVTPGAAVRTLPPRLR
jgi:hypothetical protein